MTEKLTTLEMIDWMRTYATNVDPETLRTKAGTESMHLLAHTVEADSLLAPCMEPDGKETNEC